MLLCAALLWALAALPQLGRQDRDDKARRAKLKVKSLTVYRADYDYSSGAARLGAEYKTKRTVYDRSGCVAEEVAYNRRGTVEAWDCFKSDKAGNPVLMTKKYPDGTAYMVVEFINAYDGLGRLDVTAAYLSGDTVVMYSIAYWYSREGGYDQVENYEAGRLDSYERHHYDAKGRTVLKEYYDGRDNYKGREAFKYDANGRVAEKTTNYVFVYRYLPSGLASGATSYGGASGDVPASVYRYAYEFYP